MLHSAFAVLLHVHTAPLTMVSKTHDSGAGIHILGDCIRARSGLRREPMLSACLVRANPDISTPAYACQGAAMVCWTDNTVGCLAAMKL